MVPPVPHETKKSSPESASTDPSFFGDTSPVLVEGPLTVDETELDDQSEASGVQSEGASVATTETGEEAAPVAFLSHLHCRVRMSQGYVCGRLAEVCSRRGHREKQGKLGQQGLMGYYDARPKDPRDGIEDTYRPEVEERQRDSQRHREALAQFEHLASGSSGRKPGSSPGTTTGSRVTFGASSTAQDLGKPARFPSPDESARLFGQSGEEDGKPPGRRMMSTTYPKPPMGAMTTVGSSGLKLPPLATPGKRETTPYEVPDPLDSKELDIKQLFYQMETMRDKVEALQGDLARAKIREEALKRSTPTYDDDRKMDPASEAILREMRKMQAGMTDLQTKWEEVKPSPLPDDSIHLPEVSKGESGKSKVYAVVRGRRPGIYNTWASARKQVDGFSNSLHKSFKTAEAARAWAREMTRSPSGSVDAPSDESEDEPEPKSTTPGSEIVYASCFAPDQSKGSRDALYGFSIESERSAVKMLCPKGATAEVQQELMNRATDVVALPGKTGSGTDSDVNRLADAMTEAVHRDDPRYRNRASGFDSGWKSETRNYLAKIKTSDDLHQAIAELAEGEEDITSNFRSQVRDTLSALTSYTDGQIDMYLRVGLLPYIIGESFRWYQRLLAEAAHRTSNDSWNAAKIFLDHHANKLSIVRRRAASRAQLVMRVYVYLRDSNDKSFMTVKLLEAELREIRKGQVEGESVTSKNPGGSKKAPGSCGKCGTTTLHTGGRKKCPLDKLTDAQAAKAALWVQEQLKAKPESDKDATYKAAVEKFS